MKSSKLLYYLSTNPAYSSAIAALPRTKRDVEYRRLQRIDVENIERILGRRSGKALVKKAKLQLQPFVAKKLGKTLNVSRLLPARDNGPKPLYDFVFSVVTQTRMERSRRVERDTDTFHVNAPTKTIALRLLKAELKSFYPHVFFNTDWDRVEISVKKIVFEEQLVGVRQQNYWIFQ